MIYLLFYPFAGNGGSSTFTYKISDLQTDVTHRPEGFGKYLHELRKPSGRSA